VRSLTRARVRGRFLGRGAATKLASSSEPWVIATSSAAEGVAHGLDIHPELAGPASSSRPPQITKLRRRLGDLLGQSEPLAYP
jgi:hypothetical protein